TKVDFGLIGFPTRQPAVLGKDNGIPGTLATQTQLRGDLTMRHYDSRGASSSLSAQFAWRLTQGERTSGAVFSSTFSAKLAKRRQKIPALRETPHHYGTQVPNDGTFSVPPPIYIFLI